MSSYNLAQAISKEFPIKFLDKKHNLEFGLFAFKLLFSFLFLQLFSCKNKKIIHLRKGTYSLLVAQMFPL